MYDVARIWQRSWHCLGTCLETEETYNGLSHDNQSQGASFNSGPIEYEWRRLVTGDGGAALIAVHD
jgi:hypothetical protein